MTVRIRNGQLLRIQGGELMTVPIRIGSTKVALVVLGYATAIVVGIAVELGAHSGWGVVASSGIVLLLVLVLARLSRGENESDEPRKWWRMTAYPTAGFVLSGWFVLQTIGIATSSMFSASSAGWARGVVSVILAALYLISAIRLAALDRSRDPART